MGPALAQQLPPQHPPPPQPQQPPPTQLVIPLQPQAQVQAQEGQYGGPLLIMVYGSPGMGKTVSDVYSFGPRGLAVGEPGGLRVAEHVCGCRPPVIQLGRIADASMLVYQESNLRRHYAISIDDFSLLSDRTFAMTEAVSKGFDLFKSMRDELLGFREVVRRSACCHVSVNAHERPPHVDKLSGVFIKGGPKLPGKMPEDLPAAFDCIFRVIPAPWRGHPRTDKDGVSPLFKLGWPFVFQCQQDDNYVTKDRLDLIHGIGPMNLAEMMRYRGYAVPRLASVPWQEEMVDYLAQQFVPLVAQDAPLEAFVAVMFPVRKSLLEKAKARDVDVNWTFRDAIARTWFQVSQAARSVQLYGA